jgi:tRNA pseudouridine55 synthase
MIQRDTPETKPPIDGIILVDKPRGISSFSVVSLIRRELGGRKIKVGHAGTLDPFATGLLIVLVGKATKVQRFFMALPKRYVVKARLGWTSSTGDPEGELAPGQVPDLSHLPTGKLLQRPPAYSAVKIAGQRAYKLARRGESVVLPEREVTVHRFDQIAQSGEQSHFVDHSESTADPHKLSVDEAEFVIECSSGTYVRSLIGDLGDAYCTELRRERIGEFSVERADTQKIIPLDEALIFMPEITLSEEEGIAVRYGRSIPLANAEYSGDQTIRLVDEEGLVALAEAKDGILKPIVGLKAR